MREEFTTVNRASALLLGRVPALSILARNLKKLAEDEVLKISSDAELNALISLGIKIIEMGVEVAASEKMEMFQLDFLDAVLGEMDDIQKDDLLEGKENDKNIELEQIEEPVVLALGKMGVEDAEGMVREAKSSFGQVEELQNDLKEVSMDDKVNEIPDNGFTSKVLKQRSESHSDDHGR